jgi:hypothetical protein
MLFEKERKSFICEVQELKNLGKTDYNRNYLQAIHTLNKRHGLSILFKKDALYTYTKEEAEKARILLFKEK